MVLRLVGCCLLVVVAYLSTLYNASVNWSTNGKSANLLWKYPSDAGIERPSISFVSLFVCSGDENDV